jgi:hypothetical protein
MEAEQKKHQRGKRQERKMGDNQMCEISQEKQILK